MSQRLPKVAQICGVPGWGLRRIKHTVPCRILVTVSLRIWTSTRSGLLFSFKIRTTRCWNPIHCDACSVAELSMFCFWLDLFRPKQKQSHGLTSWRTCLIHVVADLFGIQFLCCDHTCSWRPQGSTWRTTSYQRCVAAIRFTKSIPVGSMGFTFRRLDKSTWFKSHNMHSQARFLSHMSARLREDWRQKKHCLRLNLQLSASLHCRGGWSRVGWRRCSWAALNYNLILIAMQSGPLYNRQISVLSEGQSNPPKFLFTWLCSTRRILPDSAKIPACVACIGYFFLEFCCNQFAQTLWLYVLVFTDIHVIDSID